MLDISFVFVFVVIASLLEHFVFWPHLQREIAGADPRARFRGYRRVIVGQWLFAAAAFAIWTSQARPFVAMRLAMPTGWRLGLALGLVTLMVALTIVQLRSVLRVPRERRAKIGERFGAVRTILPHTRREYVAFLALSTTAGFCEELLYRGYLAWFLAPWLGDIGGMVAVVIAFGLGHSYQGRRGAIKATLAGAVMAAIVLATGSLIPAMIIHALVDAGSGTVAWLVLREPAPSVPVRGETVAAA